MAQCPLIAPSYPQVSAELTAKTRGPDGQRQESGLGVLQGHFNSYELSGQI